MIGDLVEQRKQAREKRAAGKAGCPNQADQEELNQKLDRFNEQRDQLLERARSQANHQVAQAKRKADRIIHHLRQLEIQQGAGVKENQLIDAQGR